MRHTLLDTNIYGKIAIDEDIEKIIEKIKHSDLKIHNFLLIRNELRATSKIKIIKKKQKLQKVLLEIYDEITTKSIIKEDKRINKLAEEYFKEYKKNGGGYGKKKIINDFKIVACASIRNFYIIVSDDNKSLASKKARDAYDTVNFKYKLKTSNFISYEKLKKVI